LLTATAYAAETGSISGEVSDQHGPAIAGGLVCALGQRPAGGWETQACVIASAEGKYALSALQPRVYVVEFTGLVCPVGGKTSECDTREYALLYAGSKQDGKAGWPEAKRITLGAGESVEGVSGSLALGAKISGTVKVGGKLLPGAAVCAEREAEGALGSAFEACALTDPEGQYTLSGLAAGRYVVEFPGVVCPEGIGGCLAEYVREFYDGEFTPTTADTLVLVSGQMRTGINANLFPAAIKGKVAQASTDVPLPYTQVCAIRDGREEGCAVSNSFGEYLIPLAQSGDYTVRFVGGTCPAGQPCGVRWATEYYSNKFSAALANPVHVGAGELTEAVDAGMRTTGERAVEEYLENEPPAQPVSEGTLTIPGAIEPLPVNRTFAEEFWARMHSEPKAASQMPGIEVAAHRAAVVHGVARVALRCDGSGSCDGIVRLVARAARRRVVVRRGRRVVVWQTHEVVVGSASFSIAMNASESLDVPLTSEGRMLVRRSGRKGLEVLLSGNEVSRDKLVLHWASTSNRRGG
jgi:hypothetical protein